jgi:hypothetical protein
LTRIREHLPGLVAAVSVLVIGASVAITLSVGPPRPGLYVETTEEPAVIAQAFGIPVGTGEALPYRPSSQGPFNWPGAPPPTRPLSPGLAAPEPQPLPPSATLRASLPALPPPRVIPLPRALPPLRVSPPAGEASDEPAWIANAVPAAAPDGRPEIAVIIDDAGVDRIHTGVAIRLKGPLTISFLPYASDVVAQMRAAKANSHEIMLHVPMEPHGPFAEPEPYLLRARLRRPAPRQYPRRRQHRRFRGSGCDPLCRL